MCGIAAIVSIQRAIPAGRIERMVASLAHRGPDEQGIVTTHQCHLGHRRLCVIDPAGGRQPMWDDSSRWCVTFNGEIYNFRDLRTELERSGVIFRTNSDTEVLLLAYRHWGDAAVQRLNGQFAFAIWDQHQKSLFAARDRLGEKPLFWAKTSCDELLIASEIRGILAADCIQPEIDETSVDAYLALNYVPPDRTIYQNVHTLAPGHAMMFQHGRLTTWSYWQPRLSTDPIDEVEAIRHTRCLLERAVSRQMVADTRVGAFLSGGLDSSTIVALMTRNATEPIETFGAGFGSEINELPFAKAVAGKYQTRHHELQVDIPILETLERVSEAYDEPFGDSSNIPTYLLAEFARRRVKVVLSGDGGDELFGGYEWYHPLIAHESSSSSKSRMLWLQAASKTASMLARLGAPAKNWSERARDEYKAIRAKRKHPDLWQRHLASLTESRAQRDLLWQTLPARRAESLLAKHFCSTGVQGLDRAVDFDLRCYLPGDIFVKVDRAAMAHGLETRSPFMDVELVEFVMSVPWRIRFRGGPKKWLLREACGDLWPDEVKGREKQGFGAPLAAWLRRADLGATVDRVFRSDGALASLLPGVTTHRRHLLRRPQTCWNLLCLGLWLEKRASWAHLKLAS